MKRTRLLLLPAAFLALLLFGLWPRAAAGGEGGGSFRFVVVGDTQSATGAGSFNPSVVPQLIQDMNALNPDFALFCGDLVAGAGSVAGTVAQWEQWKTATAPFTGQRYVVPGNHDFFGGAGSFAAWKTTFPWLPTATSPPGEEGLTYWFDHGNSRFVSILTDHETLGAVPPTQQAWLDGVLAASGDKEHVFVFSHHPVSFSQAEVLGTTSGAFWQSLVQNDVDAYFSGHWHRYQPSQLGKGGDTWEVICGTGGGCLCFSPIRPYQQVHGFLLVEVDGGEAVATFYADDDGDGSYDDPVDSFVMKSSTPPLAGLVAEYSFDDGTPADWAPAPLGKGIDGQLFGGAQLAAGNPTGTALELNGTGAYVEAGAIGDYNLSINGDLTLSLEARFDSLAPGVWSNTLLTYATNDFYTEDEETNYSYWLNLRDDGTLVSFWEHDDGVNVTLTSTQPAPVAVGAWHHYALVRDAAASTVTFYVDGAQLGASVPYLRNPTGGGRGMLYVGADTLGVTPFDGRIDEVRVYNEALDAASIAALASAPLLTVADFTAGATAVLATKHATPGASVLVYASFTGGGPLPTAFGDVLLSPPFVPVATLTADSLGFASTAAPVPPGTAGIAVWLQALDAGALALSNGVAETIR